MLWKANQSQKAWYQVFISGAASGALASIAWPAKIASYVPAIMTAGNAAISAAEEWWTKHIVARKRLT